MTGIMEVLLGQERIGTLQLLSGARSFFEFEESYLNNPQRPVLSQSFFKPSGELLTETKTTQVKLPPFFSNLLPEGHLRKYLARRGNVKPEREFMLLKLLGDDLPGAVVVRPLGEPKTHKDEEPEAENQKEEKPYHFSLAGVQLKFSALEGKRGGLAIPVGGVGGDWIVKLPSLNFPQVPENEWAMLHLAGEIGIPIPESRLVNLDKIEGLPDVGALSGKNALAVKRFDRTAGGKRIHIEDFAQVYNLYPDDKYGKVSYANIAQLLWTLTGEKGLTAFIYSDGRTPALTPAYDFISTVPYMPDDGLALTLSDTKDMKAVTLDHFKRLVKKAGVPEHLVLQTVKATVGSTLAAWDASYKSYDLSDDILERMQKHMQSLLIVT
ncbi:MAG: HipA domain-containing protein [Proteobacteria bacterium]|nr:HipA domain-containing protein [Pseudomonadota bacterium]